jgi:hypothetical protein
VCPLTPKQPCMLSRVAARHLPRGAWPRPIVVGKAGLAAASAFRTSTPDARASTSNSALENTLGIQDILLFVLPMKHPNCQLIAPFPRAPMGSIGNGAKCQNEFQGRRKNHALGRSSVVHESFIHRPTHSEPQSVGGRRRRPRSNFRMAESKISMLAMHIHNKIALPLCAGDAIL